MRRWIVKAHLSTEHHFPATNANGGGSSIGGTAPTYSEENINKFQPVENLSKYTK